MENKINLIELASETAMAYVENLALQLGEEHSDYNEQEETGYFKPEWQIVFDEVWDIIEQYAESQGYKHKN